MYYKKKMFSNNNTVFNQIALPCQLQCDNSPYTELSVWVEIDRHFSVRKYNWTAQTERPIISTSIYINAPRKPHIISIKLCSLYSARLPPLALAYNMLLEFDCVGIRTPAKLRKRVCKSDQIGAFSATRYPYITIYCICFFFFFFLNRSI